MVRKAPRRRGLGEATAGARAHGAGVAQAEGSESSSGDSADDRAVASDTDLDAGPARKWPRAEVADVSERTTATGTRGVASTARRGHGGPASGWNRGNNSTTRRGSRGTAEAGRRGRGGAAAGRGQPGGWAPGRGGQGGDAVGRGPRRRAVAGRGGRGRPGGSALQSASGCTPPYAHPTSNSAPPARVAAGAREGTLDGAPVNGEVAGGGSALAGAASILTPPAPSRALQLARAPPSRPRH